MKNVSCNISKEKMLPSPSHQQLQTLPSMHSEGTPDGREQGTGPRFKMHIKGMASMARTLASSPMHMKVCSAAQCVWVFAAPWTPARLLCPQKILNSSTWDVCVFFLIDSNLLIFQLPGFCKNSHILATSLPLWNKSSELSESLSLRFKSLVGIPNKT